MAAERDLFTAIDAAQNASRALHEALEASRVAGDTDRVAREVRSHVLRAARHAQRLHDACTTLAHADPGAQSWRETAEADYASERHRQARRRDDEEATRGGALPRAGLPLNGP